jgi:hypothetical protein
MSSMPAIATDSRGCSTTFFPAGPSSDRHLLIELRTIFERLIDEATLDPGQRDFLKLRCLEQVTWMEGKATKAQRFTTACD